MKQIGMIPVWTPVFRWSSDKLEKLRVVFAGFFAFFAIFRTRSAKGRLRQDSTSAGSCNAAWNAVLQRELCGKSTTPIRKCRAPFGVRSHNHLEIVAESHYKPGKDPTSQPNFGTA